MREFTVLVRSTSADRCIALSFTPSIRSASASGHIALSFTPSIRSASASGHIALSFTPSIRSASVSGHIALRFMFTVRITPSRPRTTCRSRSIEVAPPTFDDDLGLAQRVEDFAIEQFIAQARVEALDVTFSQGLPGSISAVFAPTAVTHSRTALATIPQPMLLLADEVIE